MERPCTKEHQKSHRVHWQFKEFSGPSGVWLFDSDKKQKSLDLLRKCVTSIPQALRRKELEEELLQCQDKDAEVNERTAELYSKQGNSDITELLIFDDILQCKVW